MASDSGIEQQIREFADMNPDAGVPQIAGALGVDPTLVARVLDEEVETDGARENPSHDTDDELTHDPLSLHDFDAVEHDTFPETLPDQWLIWEDEDKKRGKAPWGDDDAPAPCHKKGHTTADVCGCPATSKWGFEGNWESLEGAKEWVEMVPGIQGLIWIQTEDDPYIHIDGDNVICPETGEVHPVYEALLSHLGETYVDLSTSGTGSHAIYKGELPDGFKQVDWRIEEETWGENDDYPGIEIYDGKRNLVMTGDHVAETPDEPQPIDEDALIGIAEANTGDSKTVTGSETEVSERFENFDDDDHDPEATSSDEYTDNIEDVFYALNRLDAQRVADRTIVHRWNDDANTSEGYRAFVPTWGKNANGTANIVGDDFWQDTGDYGGGGEAAAMAAIDAGLVTPDQCPDKVKGAVWFEAVEHLRKLGFDIPRYDSGNSDGDGDDFDHAMIDDEMEKDPSHTSVIPTKMVEALEPHEVRRYARKRAPTTDETREDLEAAITEAVENEDHVVVEAPTSLGKTHTAATFHWGEHGEITGDQPVVLLQKTRETRDDAYEKAKEHGNDPLRLRSRHEACPVAAGDHDEENAVEDGVAIITVNNEDASKVIDRLCDEKGLPFSVVHQYVAEHNDQGIELPCCHGDTACPAIQQHEDLREGDHDLVIATHNFAHVPGLRLNKNIIFDEQPDFGVDIGQEDVRKAVTAFLRYVDAPIGTWEGLVQAAKAPDTWGTDAGNELSETRTAIQEDPDLDWYLNEDDAHTLAPAIARAVIHADEQSNGRWQGKTPYDPPRLDAHAHDQDGWNQLWVSVVVDDDNTVRSVRSTPSMMLARSVIGLDAYPCMPLWEENASPRLEKKTILDPMERNAWRLVERGLKVVQLGNNTRPLTKGHYFNKEKVRVILRHLREHYGDDFRTAITAMGQDVPVEAQLQEAMEEVGIENPETLHYGEEKSRNDFGDEKVGFVNGCIDPGDEPILDLLAEKRLDASPKTKVCPECEGAGCDHNDDCKDGIRREKGREFEGPDADTAQELLANVREHHVAQAAGRWARSPDDPESRATVYVRTDAMPPGFADLVVPDTVWTWNETQREVIDELRSAEGGVTAREIAENVSVTKETVRRTLNKLHDAPGGDYVARRKGAGKYGADVWRDAGVPDTGTIVETAMEDVCSTYTFTVAIDAPDGFTEKEDTETADSGSSEAGEWAWDEAYSEGDPGE